MKRRAVATSLVVLLLSVGFFRWQIWKRDNPPVTAADLKVRRILQNASFMQFELGGKRLSSQRRQTLIEHFWLASSSIEATYPQSTGKEVEIYLKLPPGQGRIVLMSDAAWSYLDIEHWVAEPPPGEGSPPITDSEEFFPLHPATNRFLRSWIAENAP